MTDMSDEEFREYLERNSDKVLEILNEEVSEGDGFKEPDGVRTKIKNAIKVRQNDQDGDPTTGEVADQLGEPRDKTEYWLEVMERDDHLESYEIGRTLCWRVK